MSLFKKLFGRKDDHRGGDGETPDFTAYVEGAMEGLRLQTQGHQDMWRFGEEEQWDYSQEDGEIIFTFPNTVVRAPARIAGTYDSVKGTWMWAWANPSILESAARDSARVREYGRVRGIRRLTTPSWTGTEEDGWRMAALTARLCGSNGVYRGPAGTAFVFFTFGEVRAEG